MSRIYGKIGFVGLWNGLAVRIAMVRYLLNHYLDSTGADRWMQIGTLTAFQWFIYDSFKLQLNVRHS